MNKTHDQRETQSIPTELWSGGPSDKIFETGLKTWQAKWKLKCVAVFFSANRFPARNRWSLHRLYTFCEEVECKPVRYGKKCRHFVAPCVAISKGLQWFSLLPAPMHPTHCPSSILRRKKIAQMGKFIATTGWSGQTLIYHANPCDSSPHHSVKFLVLDYQSLPCLRLLLLSSSSQLHLHTISLTHKLPYTQLADTQFTPTHHSLTQHGDTQFIHTQLIYTHKSGTHHSLTHSPPPHTYTHT